MPVLVITPAEGGAAPVTPADGVAVLLPVRAPAEGAAAPVVGAVRGRMMVARQGLAGMETVVGAAGGSDGDGGGGNSGGSCGHTFYDCLCSHWGGLGG